jgi:hypothetical protein
MPVMDQQSPVCYSQTQKPTRPPGAQLSEIGPVLRRKLTGMKVWKERLFWKSKHLLKDQSRQTCNDRGPTWNNRAALPSEWTMAMEEEKRANTQGPHGLGRHSASHSLDWNSRAEVVIWSFHKCKMNLLWAKLCVNPGFLNWGTRKPQWLQTWGLS